MSTQFGDNIRTLRRERDMTQEELADILGISFQAVSKWERNESLPDLLMLPKIAAFFGVTTDHLLGMDSIEQEAKIQNYIDEYSRLWAAGNFAKLSKTMQDAVREFPGEWRLTVRHFNVLTSVAIKFGDPMQVRNEAETLYRTIQSHCITDSIRIWSQKIMANYYRHLVDIEGSGIKTEDIKAILCNMPLMQNGRDLSATFLYRGEERRAACTEAICELTYLFGDVAMSMCELDLPMEEEIRALEAALTLSHTVFSDGDYGKCTPGVTRIHRLLISRYCEAGQIDRARELTIRCAEISAQFDALGEEETITHTSPIVRGHATVKHRIPYRSGKSQTDKLISTLSSLGKEDWLPPFPSTAVLNKL